MNRRGAIAGIVAAGAALAAGVYRFTDLFVKHYPPTPYDDLLSQLTDRGQAARLGGHPGRAQPRHLRPERRHRVALGAEAALAGRRDLQRARESDVVSGQR